MRVDPVHEFEALQRGIAHKFAVETGATAIHDGVSTGIRYRTPITHQWPRPISFSAEIMAVSWGDAARMRQRLLTEPGETHIAWLLGVETGRDNAAINAAGYEPCWTPALLGRALDREHLPGAAPRPVERVATSAQVAELNAMKPDYPSYESALGDAHLIELFVRDETGKPCAQGKVVVGLSNTAYVADMYTSPSARKGGNARRVLSALHDAARAKGAARAVLIQSLAARDMEFYAHAGYERVANIAVLASKDA